MKAKITHKKKQTKVDFKDKFLDAQKYAEQGFHLTDSKTDIPEINDEEGIDSAKSEELENENTEEN